MSAFLIAGVVGGTVLVCGGAALYYCNRKGKDEWSNPSGTELEETDTAGQALLEADAESERSHGGAQPAPPPAWARHGTSTTEVATLFTFAELKKVTNGFSDANIVGSGSFGDVFRGTLADGREVAVKVLGKKRQAIDDAKTARSGRPSKFSGAAQFRREVEVLGKYRHPNIVALIGHCIDGDTASAAARPCLVYEFMPGRSLQVRLRPAAPVAAGARLPPASRFVVAAGVAHGLAFLHTVAAKPVIHQDVKSDNILLQEGAGGAVRAKLADFGTVRFVPNKLSKQGTDSAPTHHSTIHVVGTQGYMPVEYCMKGRVSAKTDTFAFGVILLELLTARPAMDRRSKMLLVEALWDDLKKPEQFVKRHLDNSAGPWERRRAAALAGMALRCVLHEKQRCHVTDLVPGLDQLCEANGSAGERRGQEGTRTLIARLNGDS
eukprot:g7391.t1